MFNTIRGDLSPYRDFGAGGLAGVSALLGLPPPTKAPQAQGAFALPSNTTSIGTGATLANSAVAAPTALPAGFTTTKGGIVGPDGVRYQTAGMHGGEAPSGYYYGPADQMLPIPGFPAGAATATTPSVGSGGLIVPGINGPVAGTAPAAALPPMKAGDVNFAQLLKDRPDVLAEYNRLLSTADKNSPQYSKVGLDQGPEGYANYWLQNLANTPNPAGAPTVGGINYGQLLTDRPDVKAEFDRLISTADPHSPSFAQHGLDKGPEGFAKWWYESGGGNQGYTAPVYDDASVQAATTPYKPPVWSQEEIDKLYPQAGTTTTPGDTTTTPSNPNGPTAPGITGGGGTGDIQAYLESLPGYQFVKQQGIKSIGNKLSATGHGGIDSVYGKGLARFVTGLADQTYGEQLARMFQVAGVGQSAANQTGAFGNSAASGAGGNLVTGAQAVGNGIVGAANASAAGTVGTANAITGGLNTAAGGLLTNQVLGMYNARTPAPSWSADDQNLVGLY